MNSGKWFCALCLLLTLGLADAAQRPQHSGGKPVPLTTQRQKYAALQESKRLSRRADLFEKQGKFEEAERSAERALALEEQARGPWHLEVAHRVDQVADLYTAHKKEREAETFHERARAIRERSLSTHPDVYERDNGELRVKRNQPAEKAGPRPSSTPAAPKQ